MPMLLTVVIPVYNALPYLRKCVESVCAAPIEDMEVICVDDGSTDGSSPLLDELAAEEPRVRVVHRANGGVSAARNTGLAEARGEYVSFVDADDTLEADFLPQLLEAARSIPGADCIIGGHKRLENGVARSVPVSSVIQSVEGVVPLAATISACGKLYGRRRLQESGALFAGEVRYGEDTLFNHMAFPLCKGVLLCPACGYVYHACSGSLSSRSNDLVTDMAHATGILAGFLAAHPEAPLRDDYLVSYAVHALRRIRSMAPHAAQRECAAKVRAALQQLSLSPEKLPASLSPKNRALLRKVLLGNSTLGPGYYWKRFSRLFKQCIQK